MEYLIGYIRPDNEKYRRVVQLFVPGPFTLVNRTTADMALGTITGTWLWKVDRSIKDKYGATVNIVTPVRQLLAENVYLTECDWASQEFKSFMGIALSDSVRYYINKGYQGYPMSYKAKTALWRLARRYECAAELEQVIARLFAELADKTELAEIDGLFQLQRGLGL